MDCLNYFVNANDSDMHYCSPTCKHFHTCKIVMDGDDFYYLWKGFVLAISQETLAPNKRAFLIFFTCLLNKGGS